MGHTIESLIESWDGEAVVIRHDPLTGTWIFIALHSSVMGQPMGGTRLREYPTPADGLLDAMRLAAGMTSKWATLDIPYGGGKAVLAIPGPLETEARHGLLRRYGQLVSSLRGGFSTGEDLGTTPADMAILAQETRYVHGVEAEGVVRDPGPFTAQGVFSGMEAAARGLFGQGVEGLSILIQGVGDVGWPLAELLQQAGAELMVSDVDPVRVDRAARELGAVAVPSDVTYETHCDVFAPCAIGGILSSQTIPRLRCRLVAGSANNQLAGDEDAARLHQQGIVYVPDYVINAGGALAFALHGSGERDPRLLMQQMERVGRTVAEILKEATENAEAPLAAARRRVERTLARAASTGVGADPNGAVGAATAGATPLG